VQTQLLDDICLRNEYAKVLRQIAREVNQIWNHINALSAKVARPFHGNPKFLSGHDQQKSTAEFSLCDGMRECVAAW